MICLPPNRLGGKLNVLTPPKETKMKRKIKFIHTADLHLGSILHVKNRVPNSLENIFDNSVYEAFKNICDEAILNKVDFVLISGDIYDKEARSVKGNSYFVEQCRRLEEENIKVYAIAGNHDPIGKQSELFTLPSNVHIFGSEGAETKEFVDSEGNLVCRILGQSYREGSESRKMHKNYNVPKDEVLNVALLHTQLDNSKDYVPALPSELKEKESIQYWALGHVHKAQTINDKEPAIVFPGIPQGRDFGEEGINGAVIVEAEGSNILSIKPLPAALVVYKKLELNLNDYTHKVMDTLSDLESLMSEKYEVMLSENDETAYTPKGYIIRWTISGRSKIYNLVEDKDEDASEYLVEGLNNSFLSQSTFIYTDSVSLNIGRPIENLKEIIEGNATFKEIDMVAKELYEVKEQKEELLKGLNSLWELPHNPEDYNLKKLQLNNELYEEILEKAQQLIMDHLLEDGE